MPQPHVPVPPCDHFPVPLSPVGVIGLSIGLQVDPVELLLEQT